MEDIANFYCIGINYKKTDVSIRGRFAIQSPQYDSIIQQAAVSGVKELFVLSTCNRTEIYGLATDVDLLIDLMCETTNGDKALFLSLCYTKSGLEAVQHFFNVGSGLDSQILGDYEIVGQIKTAVKYAKSKGSIGPFIERLYNTVLQSSKEIKNNTQLSTGTVSVSFAVIHYLKTLFASLHNQKVVIIGTGKMGLNTCKNLIDYVQANQITLINRTDEKAAQFAAQLNINTAPYTAIAEEIQDAAVIIVATNATAPIIDKGSFFSSSPKALIDLSVPNNIATDVVELNGLSLVNVDDLSKLNDETLQSRLADEPKARQIIEEHIVEFTEWVSSRRFAPVIHAAKQKLITMNACKLFLATPNAKLILCKTDAIPKAIKKMVVKLKSEPEPGCDFIMLLNDYMTVN